MSLSVHLIAAIALAIASPAREILAQSLSEASSGARRPVAAAHLTAGVPGLPLSDHMTTPKGDAVARHVAYGAGAGLVLWVVYYFTLPCDPYCEEKATRVIVLPAFVAIGAMVGAIVGVSRHRHRGQ